MRFACPLLPLNLIAVLVAWLVAGVRPAQAEPDTLSSLSQRVKELEARLAPAPAPSNPPDPPKPQPLDVREPPFSEFDYSWTNGANRQPASLLTAGPIDMSIYADVYYLFQFHQPQDHTAFPGTTAPRHNEISLNLASVGIEVSRLHGPIGRVYVQYGTNVQTDVGQDLSTTRGFYLTNVAFQFIQQAAAGWHFDVLHGVNVEAGIFPSYFSLESYFPQENWSYLHAFIADATPYYFSGIRTQIFLTRRFRAELWLVNGWQTLGQWHEYRGGGYDWNWRPTERLVLSNAIYLGQDVQADPDAVRFYTDNSVQVQYYKGPTSGRGFSVKRVSMSADFGYGYEHRGNAPSGNMTGGFLSHRVEWSDRFATTLRGDIFYDQTQAVIQQFPVGSPYSLPNKGAFLGGGISATMDFLPSPWILFRLEYMHREANLPYFSGARGITGPGGVLPTNPGAQMGFVPDLQDRDDRLVVNTTLRL